MKQFVSSMFVLMAGAQPNAQLFRKGHPDYQKIMTSCLRNLYSGD